MHPTYKRMLKKLKEKEAGSKRRKKEPWFVYLLRCADDSLYTGITKDLERRLKMHQSGKASRYTRTHLPVKMVYHEECKDRTSALVRECEIKEWPRKKKEQLVQGLGTCS